MDAQDLETPEDAGGVADRLQEVQQLHSQLAQRAERRTALIGKVGTGPTFTSYPHPIFVSIFLCICICGSSCSDAAVAAAAPGDDRQR